MKYVLISLLSWTFCAIAQNVDEDTVSFDPSNIDHLEPISDYGNMWGNSKILFENEYLNSAEFPIIQYVKQPYCESPVMISILKNENQEEGYRVAYTHSKKNKSNTIKRLKKRHIETTHRKISQETATDIQRLYEMVLINTHYSKNSRNVWWMDCATEYHFYGEGPKYRRMFGGAISPEPHTPPGKLIQISDSLIAFALDDMDESTLALKVTKAIKSVKTH
jgi:RNase P protein component